MKLVKLIAIGILATQTMAATASEEQKGWVGGYLQYLTIDSDKPEPIGYLDDGTAFGGEIGYKFKPKWGARLELARLDLDATNSSNRDGEKGNRIGLDLMYFMPNSDLYTFVGVKSENLVSRENLGNIGLGKHWELGDSWKVITEWAFYHDFGEGFVDSGIKLGLARPFGEIDTSQKTDRDGDGVYDHKDTCPNTPAGSQVDANGCMLDSDGDGVANNLDQCPNSPAGSQVNGKGCPIDSDMDGVSDALDQCPNTPRGHKVDSKGCSLDNDQDGVLNKVDKCLNTPKGDQVGTDGCSVLTEKEVSVQLEVNFANNSAKVENPEDSQFQEFADFMARFANTNAEIEGHTSAQGAASYNQSLSEKRAKAVRNLLINNYGVSASRLTAKGYGESRLLDDANTAQAHAANRRISARVSAKEMVKE